MLWFPVYGSVVTTECMKDFTVAILNVIVFEQEKESIQKPSEVIFISEFKYKKIY